MPVPFLYDDTVRPNRAKICRRCDICKDTTGRLPEGQTMKNAWRCAREARPVFCIFAAETGCGT